MFRKKTFNLVAYLLFIKALDVLKNISRTSKALWPFLVLFVLSKQWFVFNYKHLSIMVRAVTICCIFWPALRRCALQVGVHSAHSLQLLVKICIFNGKKLKKKNKARNSQQNLTKTKKMTFLSLHQNAGRVFYSQIINT